MAFIRRIWARQGARSGGDAPFFENGPPPRRAARSRHAARPVFTAAEEAESLARWQAVRRRQHRPDAPTARELTALGLYAAALLALGAAERAAQLQRGDDVGGAEGAEGEAAGWVAKLSAELAFAAATWSWEPGLMPDQAAAEAGAGAGAEAIGPFRILPGSGGFATAETTAPELAAPVVPRTAQAAAVPPRAAAERGAAAPTEPATAPDTVAPRPETPLGTVPETPAETPAGRAAEAPRMAVAAAPAHPAARDDAAEPAWTEVTLHWTPAEPPTRAEPRDAGVAADALPRAVPATGPAPTPNAEAPPRPAPADTGSTPEVLVASGRNTDDAPPGHTVADTARDDTTPDPGGRAEQDAPPPGLAVAETARDRGDAKDRSRDADDAPPPGLAIAEAARDRDESRNRDRDEDDAPPPGLAIAEAAKDRDGAKDRNRDADDVPPPGLAIAGAARGRDDARDRSRDADDAPPPGLAIAGAARDRDDAKDRSRDEDDRVPPLVADASPRGGKNDEDGDHPALERLRGWDRVEREPPGGRDRDDDAADIPDGFALALASAPALHPDTIL